MHEFSLCESIIQQVARSNHNQLMNIADITLEVGSLAGVDLESLCFWFPVVANKLAGKNLKLIVNQINGRAQCNQCSHEYELHHLYDPCPQCSVFGNYQILQGRELLIKSYSLIA